MVFSAEAAFKQFGTFLPRMATEAEITDACDTLLSQAKDRGRLTVNDCENALCIGIELSDVVAVINEKIAYSGRTVYLPCHDVLCPMLQSNYATTAGWLDVCSSESEGHGAGYYVFKARMPP